MSALLLVTGEGLMSALLLVTGEGLMSAVLLVTGEGLMSAVLLVTGEGLMSALLLVTGEAFRRLAIKRLCASCQRKGTGVFFFFPSFFPVLTDWSCLPWWHRKRQFTPALHACSFRRSLGG